MLLAIESPFPQFRDTDGSPLDGGYLYFGLENQNPETNPITVYWDVNGTQPAVQPIRTLNGVIARNGTPAQLYVATAYSLTVRNRRKKLVYTSADSVAYSQAAGILAIFNAFITQLASSAGASLVGFIQAGVGAVTRTLQDKIRDSVPVHPRDFNCKCDGTDDTVNFLKMLNEVSAANIDCGGVTIGLSAQVTKNLAAGANFQFKNLRVASLGIPDIDAGFINIQGPGFGAAATVAAVTKGSKTLTLTSGTLIKGQDIVVRSSDLWCDIAYTGRPSVTMGEDATVADVSGTTVTLKAPLRYDYNNAVTATVIGLAGTVTVENVTGVSDNTSFAHCPLQIQYAKTARAKNVMGSLCSYAGMYFAWCKYVFSEDCGNEDPDPALGLGYGVLTAYATREATHIRPRGRNCRHVSAKGGYDSIICTIADYDAVGDNQQEAVIDAHENIDEQLVVGGSASFVDNVNGKLASVQSRRLRIVGMRGSDVAVGIVASPCCTAYPSSVDISGCDISALTNAIDIEIRSPMPMEYLSVQGHYVGGTGGSQGDAIFIGTSSSYVNVGGTHPPGQYKTVEVDARAVGLTQRALYILGSAGKAQTFGDVHIRGHYETGTAAGQFPCYVNVATVGDVVKVEAIGDFVGGAANSLRLDNVNMAYARITASGYGQDAIFNNQSGAADALNRFDLQAIIPSTAGIDQHRGQFVANGVTPVTVNNSCARPGSRFMFSLKTAGGTPGVPRPGTIVSGTSVAFSSTAGDTSTWNYWLENPTTGP